MSDKTSIGWTESSWNPTVGCTHVSPGCDNCYAETLAINLQKRGMKKYALGFEPIIWRPHLELPLHWRRPRRIFVNSMSDTFHPAFPEDYIREIWDVMLTADQHVYQVLTKRPNRMRLLTRRLRLETPPHIWIGVSAETQSLARNRLPVLLDIPAAVRWVSAEPLLEPLDLTPWLGTDRINWIVTGAESGPERRPVDDDWFRAIRDQCQKADVPFYHKQGSAFRSGQHRTLDGRLHDDMPGSHLPTLMTGADTQ